MQMVLTNFEIKFLETTQLIFYIVVFVRYCVCDPSHPNRPFVGKRSFVNCEISVASKKRHHFKANSSLS